MATATPRAPPMTGEQHAFDEGLADETHVRGAHGDADGDLGAVFEAAGEHEIGEVAAGDKEDTSGCYKKQLEAVLVFVAHGGDAGTARDDVEGLFLPERLFAGLHIRDMAGKPLVKLDAELGLQLSGVGTGTDAADEVEIVALGAIDMGDNTGIKGFLGGSGDPDVGHAPAGELGSVEAGRERSR